MIKTAMQETKKMAPGEALSETRSDTDENPAC